MDEDPAVSLFDLPASERVYGRCPNGFAAAKIETGVMPGAPYAGPDYEPFGERPVIVAAISSDCENPGRVVYQQDLLVAHMTCELSI
jgi:hypothetical protein